MPVLLALALACHRPETDSAPDDSDVPPVLYDDDLGTRCTTTPDALRPAPPVTRSFPFLPTSNGYVAAQYALDARALVAWNDALPRNPTATTTSRDHLWDAYFGVRIDGVVTWLNTVPIDQAGYLDESGIVEITQHVGDVTVSTAIIAPYGPAATNDLVLTATLAVAGNTPHDVALLSLQNVHTGGEGSADGEAVVTSARGVLETRGQDAVLHTPIDVPAHLAAAPAGDGRNPWMRGTANQAFGDDVVSGDDVAVGFDWGTFTLSQGSSITRGVLLSHGSADALQAHADAFLDSRSAASVWNDERDGWTAWHALDTPPAGLTADELHVFRQSTAVLRMAQVRAPGPGAGQLLASLPPGIWNVAWPRDGAYATVGLVHSGHSAEAKAFLQFILDADAGAYADNLGIDDYLVSVCRYTGDGREESDGASCPDGSDAGPNIELDDFGLFLWAFGEYAIANPTDPWVEQSLPAVLAGVADPLVQLIDPNRNLLVPDSSIWERHWEPCFPNGRKRFTYSTIQAVAGLRVAGQLSGNAAYTDASERLRSGLLRSAAVGGPVLLRGECPVLASAPEETCEGCGPLDGSVIELIDQGVVRPESTLAIGTLQALQAGLAMDSGSPGFLRNDDGAGSSNPYPWYDDQEWVVIDLRMAAAYAKVGRATGEPTYTANGRLLLDWVTANAVANAGLIPELLSDGRYTAEDDADGFHLGQDPGADFQGAVPMVGFGPGAYVLALEAVAAPPPGP